MQAWVWTVLVLVLCVLGLAAAPLYTPVTALDPATAAPTSRFWDDTADEVKSPWSIWSPAHWSFMHLLGRVCKLSTETVNLGYESTP